MLYNDLTHENRYINTKFVSSSMSSTKYFDKEMLWPGTRSLESPVTVMADSYKAAHPSMYPPATYMTAYGEFREPFKGMTDRRIVVYGIRHYIEQLVSRSIRPNDIDAAITFYQTHGMNKSEFPYPADIFERMRASHHFPVKIEALPEGSVVYPHTPVYIITAENQDSHFCTFLETILTMIWYPSTVATLSRQTKQLIKHYFDIAVEQDAKFLLDSRLHDFGFRGCTCVEQSVIGGCAHLLSFTGSDTMSACFHAQFHLNEGVAVGESLPATEHSVMTSWGSEIEAIRNLIRMNEGKFVACVMDSYDYDNALNNILPKLVKEIIEARVTLILRPDSGDPVQQVVKALKAARAAGFPCVLNAYGFKVLSNVAVIQGDGICYDTIRDILEEAVIKEHFSPENIAFGMGGGLLQKVNRDTMSFATKLSYIQYDKSHVPESVSMVHSSDDGLLETDGEPVKPLEKDVLKRPASDGAKTSIPGKIMVLKEILPDGKFGPHMVYTEQRAKELLNPTDGSQPKHANSMVTVYDKGNDIAMSATKQPIKHCNFDRFQVVKDRLAREWVDNQQPDVRDPQTGESKPWDPLDESIIALRTKLIKQINDDISAMQTKPEGTRSEFHASLKKINQALASMTYN